jgi:ferredoxin
MNGGETLFFDRLAAATGNGLARHKACAAAARTERQPAAIVSYASNGEVLVTGPESQALAAAEQLRQQGGLNCTVVATSRQSDRAEPGSGETRIIRDSVQGLVGHLGQFRIELASASPRAALPPLTAGDEGGFDLVLDLNTPPLLRREVPPPGYYAPQDADALQRALQEIPTLVGEFEKPRYFQYDASICAHGRSGITACTRCLDACPTDAITSDGDSIRVDAKLCQGAGSCATACPSGAITYAYPRLSDNLQRLRVLFKSYRQAGGTDAVLLLHDAHSGRDRVAAAAEWLPENLIPCEIEELGSAGMDIWLAALAYGARSVCLLTCEDIPASVTAAIDAQLKVAQAIVAGMGYPAEVLYTVSADSADFPRTLGDPPAEFAPAHAEFAPLDEKRTVIRLAVDHLFAQAPAPRPLVALPAGAPFGEIEVDAERCTLCMACVSQCPANALSAGDDTPQLKFVEANCLQCGLCCRSCPENAIAASPRLLFDAIKRNTLRVLHEEEPFCCVRCGKPFATRSVIERITRKMKGHPMFGGDALQRIAMCEDCRVEQLYHDEQASISLGDSR